MMPVKIIRKLEWLQYHGVAGFAQKVLYRFTLIAKTLYYDKFILTRACPAIVVEDNINSYLAPATSIRALISEGLDCRQALKLADKVCKDSVFIHGYGYVDLNSLDAAAPVRLIDRMDYLYNLIIAYQYTDNVKYKQKALSLFNHWLNDFSHLQVTSR